MAAGLTSVAIDAVSPDPAGVQVQRVVFGAPLPLEPAPGAPEPEQGLPTADQLNDILTKLSDAGVSYHEKQDLVEGGIQPDQGHLLDHELRQAYRDGELPFTFTITNIQPAGPNTASADVAISGPKLPAPITTPAIFANQNGWVLAQASAVKLVQLLQSR
ncbi:MAG TPA: hypothetical protein VFQ37_08290 [Mycobacterium sp.]|nr:hypothetical protein [Mycobacterium sp.]